jgi:hypothetical protein
MTIGELRDELDYLIEDEQVSKNTELRLAHQPQWAFEYSLSSGVSVVDDIDHGAAVAYITEGHQIGYLPQAAADAVGW